MKQLFYSSVSGQVHFGNGKPLKNKPGVSVISGEIIDVTQSFYDCLFQKFPPGGSYLIESVDHKPMYKLTIERIPEGK
jgi:hypothetical protein